MTAHLLPVSAAWLAKLPSGVALYNRDRVYLGRTAVDGVGHVYLIDAGSDGDRVPGLVSLGLTDTVTAAAVAAKIVRKWLDGGGFPGTADRGLGGSGLAYDSARALGLAERMEPLTPTQVETLARLARAAMEEG